MANVRSWMGEARRLEESGDLEGAIDRYRKTLALQEETTGSADLSLYNRIGDLYLRSGDTGKAVAAYTRAVDHYEEQQLYSNAIALCKKILRNAPGFTAAYRRAGRLLALSGLEAEARSHYLDFATRIEREGKLSESLEALREYVELSEDEDVRLSLAERYHAGGQVREAVGQLTAVWTARMERGADASDVRTRILEIDPAADPAADRPTGANDGDPSGGDADPEKSGMSDEAESDAATLARSLQQVLDGLEGEERMRQALPILDQLLQFQPDKVELLQRKLTYALALDDEPAAVQAYLSLGSALERRLSRFSLRFLTTSSSSGGVTSAISLETRPVAGQSEA